MLALACLAAAPPLAFAQADLFPFGFPNEAAAVAACPSLLSGEGISRAGRGALVYVVRPGEAPQLIASGSVPFWAPSLAPVPVQARALGPVSRDRSGALIVPVFDARSPMSGVRCWFRPMDGAIRLVTIEIMVER